MPTCTVSADVGGTFTDCLIDSIDATGQQQVGCIKVLSSGIIRARAIQQASPQQFQLQLPPELLSSLPGNTLPDGFFVGARVCLLAGVDAEPLGSIVEFAGDTHLLTLDGSPTATASPNESDDCLLEIDCQLESPVLATHLLLGIPIGSALPAIEARIGTTKGTNALLTRGGADTALITTAGFKDVLRIGNQDRSDLFELTVRNNQPLADQVVEISARRDSDGEVLQELDRDQVQSLLEQLKQDGIQSVAISLLHAHVNAADEIEVQRLAQSMGFAQVCRSSEVSPLIHLVSRSQTTCLDAYLGPILTHYVQRVQNQFGGDRCQLELMTSSGNLVPASQFRGRDSVLSGPAGGVVGLSHVALEHDQPLAIGLDMGGTSTDVSRYDGQVGRRYETKIADIRLMTPMMDIHTVAAGGGSVCDYVDGRLLVGPGSAGAAPGPACYGAGGPLTITDINLILGRIAVDRFPFPLDIQAAQSRLQHVTEKMPQPPASIESLAEGFIEIAVTHMAEAVRAITTARGRDARDHALIGFGGAAAQHLCRVADALQMKTIIDHPRASVLSALGIGVAPTGTIQTTGIYQTLSQLDDQQLHDAVTRLVAQTETQPAVASELTCRVNAQVDCRYVGTEATIALPYAEETRVALASIAKAFHQEHQSRYGYQREDAEIEVVSIRVERTAWDLGRLDRLSLSQQSGPEHPAAPELREVFYQGQWRAFQSIDRNSLSPGDSIPNCSLVVSDQSTLIVEADWSGTVTADGSIVLRAQQQPRQQAEHGNKTQSHQQTSTNRVIRMEIIARRMQSIADAMGQVLQRTAISVNVKERLDFSCAIFQADGTLIANAPHVPVHLGAMGHTVRALHAQFPTMYRGDCYVSNDPYRGGSHLPDVTVVTPVFRPDSQEPDFFVASRAHHAEIGGITPGSMPPAATHLAEEGVLISGFALVRQGKTYESELASQLAGAAYPSRNVAENLADIRAQVAAGQEGVKLISELMAATPFAELNDSVNQLLRVADASVRRWIQTLPHTPLTFADQLDDGWPICVTLQRQGDRLHIDFTGTGDVHPGAFNATPSIVGSAVLYVLRCHCDSNLPLCEGALWPIDLNIPTGLLRPPSAPDPTHCAAVVAGNVETSQRVVDVLLGAIGTASDGQHAVAASQGTMNNVLIGDESFGYYETIGGGCGATARGPGANGIHSHMTNTRITDAEVLESRLPIRLIRFALRENSAGQGEHPGGQGLVREFEFLRPLTVSLLTGRRLTAPYGVAGGQNGQPGRNSLADGDGEMRSLPPCTTLAVKTGDRLIIETPGGGGWSAPQSTLMNSKHHQP